jgi:hypothetical protein
MAYAFIISFNLLNLSAQIPSRQAGSKSFQAPFVPIGQSSRFWAESRLGREKVS